MINADPSELEKFSALAHRWWDPTSEFKPLHDINPLRLEYIDQRGGRVVFSTINRNPKAYLFAILGAEYMLKLLPRGTHEYARFLKPAEVAALARKAGLEPDALIGMTYNALNRSYRLERDTTVNYIATFRRDA